MHGFLCSNNIIMKKNYIVLFVKEGGRRLSTLKQGGLPEDVAELIGFLCSPLSDGINGNCIRVCGGSMIGA